MNTPQDDDIDDIIKITIDNLSYAVDRSEFIQDPKQEKNQKQLDRERDNHSLTRFNLDSTDYNTPLLFGSKNLEGSKTLEESRTSEESKTLKRLRIKLANKGRNSQQVLSESLSLFQAKLRTYQDQFSKMKDESVAKHGNISIPSSAQIKDDIGDDGDAKLDIVKTKKRKKRKQKSLNLKY
jgi:hypothetical protein